MRQLFTRLFQRPIAAIASSMALIGQTLPPRLLMDGIVGRFVYALIKIEPAENGEDNTTKI